MKEVFQHVYSPCDGFVKKVFVTPSSYVYEWEKLFVIETNENKEVEVSIGVSGNITSVEISQGQNVEQNTILTTLRDDFVITGSD
ncbi:biotin/lipoyl-containing protein [Pontibacillus sp. HMF3514]|uniref:biotin/lipoyl-containing protein n=1 Tax=Pontibacillus sp. HMF3514 TaxID=2692425 RepID=UPI00131FC003|nr:biotin/lipoyl-containing protein [Pontibacillus sp. HMF3514]QHE50910.1 hypothetical protein GS400_02135 [Pontibacillus sp. HMF3514]